MGYSDHNIPVEKPVHVNSVKKWPGLALAGLDIKERRKLVVQMLLNSPDHGLSEKIDGNRVVLYGDGRDQQVVLNKLGQPQVISVNNPRPLPLHAADPIKNLGVPYIFDGEALGGRGQWYCYIIFNVIMFNGHDWTRTSQFAREDFLGDLARHLELPYTTLPLWPGPPVMFLKTETTPVVKHQLYTMLRMRQPVSEGVIFRNMKAPLVQGETPYVYKDPFVFQLDAVAYRWNPATNNGPGRGGSVNLGVYHQGQLKDIGGLRSGLSYDRLEALEQLISAGKTPVLRVEFLGKRTVGIKLSQPRCLEIRDDKLPYQCLSDQLIHFLRKNTRQMFDEAAIVRL